MKISKTFVVGASFFGSILCLVGLMVFAERSIGEGAHLLGIGALFLYMLSRYVDGTLF